MDIAKIFRNGGSQAVRLPKAYQFDDDEVIIKRVAGAVILYPKHAGWDILERSLGAFGPEAVPERDQGPSTEAREVW